MTLLRQLMLVLSLLFVMLFSAIFVLALFDARESLERQLASHAQDTATALGVAIATAVDEADAATVEGLVNAVFDRGFYAKISLVDLDQTILFSKTNPLRIDGVPPWFVGLADLPSPAAATEVTKGWRVLGTLTVVSNPAQAYRDLWRVTQHYSYLLAFMMVLTYLLIGAVLKVLLRPLLLIEQQIAQIGGQDFVMLDEMPRTHEFKRLAEAINLMALKLRALFQQQLQLMDSLRREANADALTGLMNRKAFNAQVESQLGAYSMACALMLVQIKQFNQFNNTLGRQAADDFLCQVAQCLLMVVQHCEGAIVARYNGADFAVFLPQASLEDSRRVLQQSFSSVNALAPLVQGDHQDTVQIGMVYDTHPQSLSNLLTESDTALRHAQSTGRASTELLIYDDQTDLQNDTIKSASEWQATLARTIDSHQILFHYQPVLNLRTSQRLAYAVFVRIVLDGRAVNAGEFMPAAERFDLLPSMDKLIITTAFAEIDLRGPQAPDMIINLSTGSLQDASFMAWLMAYLPQHPKLAPKVIFELQEAAVRVAFEPTKNLVNLGNGLGYRFAVGHFGAGTTNFAYLHSLNVHFIKIDRRFVSAIASQPDHQFFVESVVNIAHSRKMLVIAEGVESAAEASTLKQLGVDAAMGYWFARPAPGMT
ncbi:EAL domain-containing protein [Pseudomonadales bacterium]|nr:EAL domain-containing protein [Pseudomonadales bacterium]